MRNKGYGKRELDLWKPHFVEIWRNAFNLGPSATSSYKAPLMKRCIPFVLLLCFLASCSGGFRIEQRQYRNGFYISTGKQNSVYVQSLDEETFLVTDTSGLLRSDEEMNAVTALTEETEKVLPTDHFSPTEKTDVEITAPPRDTAKKERKKLISYKGPAEARKAALYYRYGLAAAVAGASSFVLSFIPYVGLFFGLMGALLLAAIVLEIIALVEASDGVYAYSGKDPDLAEYFKKIRRRAWWVLAGIFIGYALLLVLLLLILVH